MYQKRPAWILTGVAPNRGADTRLRDIVLAVQTEIPLVKQHLCDQLWAVRGAGVEATRLDRLTGRTRAARAAAVARRHDRARLRVGEPLLSRRARRARGDRRRGGERGRSVLRRRGRRSCFEDQYISTGGQLYELMVGHDRYVADLRPLLRRGVRRPRAAASALLPSVRSLHDPDRRGARTVDHRARPARRSMRRSISRATWRGSATRTTRCVARWSPRCSRRCGGAGCSARLIGAMTLERWRGARVARRTFVAPVMERLRALRDAGDARVHDDAPVYIARAPGRLDVMGGIADYSGSLVLQLPLEVATTVVVQPSDERTIELASLRSRDGKTVEVRDPARRAARGTAARPRPAARARRRRAERIGGRRTCSVSCTRVSCVTDTRLARAPADSGMLILSDVPEGKGVSSSAALEVASLAAIAARYDVSMRDEEIATASQWAENHVAGAPCGIMDQMTSACGRRDRLLRLRCQPDIVEGHVAIPAGLALLWDRFGDPARGDGLGLRHRAHGGVHGLSNHRGDRRTAGDDRRVERARARFALAWIPREHLAERIRVAVRGAAARVDDAARSSSRGSAGSRTS